MLFQTECSWDLKHIYHFIFNPASFLPDFISPEGWLGCPFLTGLYSFCFTSTTAVYCWLWIQAHARWKELHAEQLVIDFQSRGIQTKAEKSSINLHASNMPETFIPMFPSPTNKKIGLSIIQLQIILTHEVCIVLVNPPYNLCLHLDLTFLRVS